MQLYATQHPSHLVRVNEAYSSTVDHKTEVRCAQIVDKRKGHNLRRWERSNRKRAKRGEAEQPPPDGISRSFPLRGLLQSINPTTV